MGVNYNKLWKLLIDKNMKKKELCELASISPTTLAKIGNNGDVSTSILTRICYALNCDFNDIMEIIKE